MAAGADFLTAEIPARPAALAGAFGAFNDDATAFQWNPAALGKVPQPMVGATHYASIVDTQFNQASFIQPLRVWGSEAGLGLSIQYSSTGNFEQIDAAGNDVGAVDNYDLVVSGAGGLALSRTLRLGVAAKMFNSRLSDYRSRGFAVDLGGQSDLNDRVSLGVALLNVGAEEAYDQVADPLPTAFELSGRVLVVDSPEVMIQGCTQLNRPWSTNGPITLGLGAEYWYHRSIVFRAGWRFGADLGPFSLGAGFKYRGFTIDYAYNTLGELGLTHRLSLGVELGTLFSRMAWMVDPIQGQRPEAPAGPTHINAPQGAR